MNLKMWIVHSLDCAWYVDHAKYLLAVGFDENIYSNFGEALTIFFPFLKPTLIEECAMLPKCARHLATPGKYHDFLRSGIAPRSPYYTRGTQLLDFIQNLNFRLGIQT